MIRFSAISVLLVMLLASAMLADDGSKSPEDIFKAKGLIKDGFMLIVPQEKALHDSVIALRAAKAKLSAAESKIRDADAQINTAEKNLKATEADDHELNLRIANGHTDAPTIARHNLLVDSIKSQIEKIESLLTAREKMLASRSDYVTATLDASAKADAAQHAYDEPRADKELATAIDTYNLTAKPKVKLGPSGYLQEDVAFVAKCKTEVTTGTIPITLDGGVPNVEVLINGSVNETMVWDSGATGVCLSAKTAKDLGLKLSNSDQIVESTIADGSKVKQHVVMVDSIRIGPYTVEHVPCIVAAKGTEGADLLGNEFQHHFQFKLDVNNATLQLTPLDALTFVRATTKPVQPVAKPAPVVKPAVLTPSVLPITGATPTVEMDAIKKLLQSAIRSKSRSPMPADTITGKTNWDASPGGYVLNGKLQIGDDNSAGQVTAQPGFILEGGTLSVTSGELNLAGSASNPCVLIGTKIDRNLHGNVKATNTIFQNCAFSKAGGWFARGGYSSKWAFSNCLVDKCQFRNLNRMDYGVQFESCAFVETAFPARHRSRGKNDDPTEDQAAIAKDTWNRITQCDFFQCELAPSAVCCFDQCNCFQCTTVKKPDAFSSRTNLSVEIGIAAGDEKFIGELTAMMPADGVGHCTYTATPFIPRMATARPAN